MQHSAQRICQPSLLLAALAFAASWFMTGKFDDDFARGVLSTAFASWVAASSGITGFLLLKMEEVPSRKQS